MLSVVSRFGCCSDNITSATGPDEQGCKDEEISTMSTTDVPLHCSNTSFGCCPDGSKSAEGVDFEGCFTFSENCTESYFGCCPDGINSGKQAILNVLQTDCSHSRILLFI